MPPFHVENGLFFQTPRHLRNPTLIYSSKLKLYYMMIKKQKLLRTPPANTSKLKLGGGVH